VKWFTCDLAGSLQGGRGGGSMEREEQPCDIGKSVTKLVWEAGQGRTVEE